MMAMTVVMVMIHGDGDACGDNDDDGDDDGYDGGCVDRDYADDDGDGEKDDDGCDDGGDVVVMMDVAMVMATVMRWNGCDCCIERRRRSTSIDRPIFKTPGINVFANM